MTIKVALAQPLKAQRAIMTQDFSSDLESIASIAAVPTILEVVCRSTGMGFAAVARVTEDRWVACGVRDEIEFGLQPGGELKIETTICNEIRDHRQLVVIDHVDDDPVYRHHHTPALYGLQSYISMPIILPDGQFFGTLCAIDPKPHVLNNVAIIGMFKLFAELIAFHLSAHQQVARSEADLRSEQHSSETREQFIAVLGHDLRNPLAALDGAVRMIMKADDVAKARELSAMMQKSIRRMANLIDHVLDFARGKLGGGITLELDKGVDLRSALDHVVSELRSAHPESEIIANLDSGQADCDPVRIGQLASNLIANAVTHGAERQPITVTTKHTQEFFELSVTNAGDAIPPAVIKELFKPFSRASVKPSQQGLGLGLYICSEIAKAHAGTLDVTSTTNRTSFIFRIPTRQAPVQASP